VVGLEVCVDSVASALAAEAGGATRLELCEALVEGGLTPSIGKVQAVLESTSLPVHVMVRPRAGDFLYDSHELRIMRADIAALKRAGANGLVLGVLTPQGEVDAPLLRSLVQEAAPLPVSFHRAVDVCRDPVAAVDVLIQAGVARVLTSGGAPAARDGVETLRQMVQVAAGRIVVAAGGGVTEANAASLAQTTEVDEVHGTLRASMPGRMQFQPARVVYMGGEKKNTPEGEFELRVAQTQSVRAASEALWPLAAHGGDRSSEPSPHPLKRRRLAGELPLADFKARRLLGIDVGGTNIRAAVVSGDGAVEANVSLPVAERSSEAVVSRVLEACDAALSQLGLSRSDVSAAGCGAPGLIEEQGVVSAASSFPSWRRVPLAQLLENRLHVPVTLVNDAVAAAAAEGWVGAAAGAGSDVAVVTLGTGVGVSLVMADGSVCGCEGGHHIIDASESAHNCPCGQRGCWEAHVSARALLTRHADAEAGAQRSAGSCAAMIFDAAARGDARAAMLIDELCAHLAVGCINLCRLARVSKVVLAGGLAQAGEPLIESVTQHVKRRCWSVAPPAPVIVGSAIADAQAGVVGAARMAAMAIRRGNARK